MTGNFTKHLHRVQSLLFFERSFGLFFMPFLPYGLAHHSPRSLCVILFKRVFVMGKNNDQCIFVD